MPDSSEKQPYWETKSLQEMSTQEWEDLCDRCGYCCLVKLQDEDTDEVYITNVACRLLNLETCECQNYPEREQQVSTCMSLTPANLPMISWLPDTCAYRCLSENRPLPDWHPLITGHSIIGTSAGVSVCGMALPEEAVHPEQLEDHIIDKV